MTTETKTGAKLIAEERARQIAEEGWTPEHDDEHADGELTRAALIYLRCAEEQHPFTEKIEPHILRQIALDWPWDIEWLKPKDRMRNLVRAGALIAAEIDRLQRAAEGHEGSV